MSLELISRRDVLRGAVGVAASAAGLVAASPVGAVALPSVSGVVSSSTGLNLRTGPGAYYPVAKWLPNGTTLTIRQTSGDWFRVRTGGWTGWVNSWYVLLTGTPSVAITRGNTAVKRVALTFDCGSDYGFTDKILATLAKHGVPASFGICGDWISAFPDGATKIAGTGHQLINHTLDHRSFTGLSTPGTGPRSPAKRLSQIQANETLIRNATGVATKPYWRPPYGDYDSGVLRDVGALGYTRTVMWTIDSLGWNGLTADQIYWRVMNRMAWGAIVLMHVGGQSQDGNALDRLIRALEIAGYSFGTVAQVVA